MNAVDKILSAMSISNGKRSTRVRTECQVCSDSAIYSYFGVIVCASCKMFFRRNAQKKQGLLKCNDNGHCEINVNIRRVCSACRLTKCFYRGMQVELFRGSIQSKKKNIIQDNRIVQLPTLNLLERDQSNLSVNQWNQLSNIIHCYDEYRSLCFAHQFFDDQQKLPFKRRFRMGTIEEMMQIFASNVQYFYTKNVDFLSLSSSNRSILLRRTMVSVASLSCCFLAYTSQLLSNTIFSQKMESTYGEVSSHYGLLTAQRLDRDIISVKLIMALMIFSTFDCSTSSSKNNYLEETTTILKIQDQYIELTWRYLLYRYDHQRAVLCFSNLIRALFSLHYSLSSIEVGHYNEMIDSLVQQTELLMTT